MIKKCKSCNIERFIKAREYCRTCYTRLNRHGKIPIKTPTEFRKHILTQIDSVNKIGKCATDGVVKIQPRNKAHTQWSCSVSVNQRTKAWKQKKREIKKAMLNNKCDICEISGVKLCWDHRHTDEPAYWDNLKYNVKEFRGTLCNNCNLALGLLKDNPENFYRAYKYLKKTK